MDSERFFIPIRVLSDASLRCELRMEGVPEDMLAEAVELVRIASRNQPGLSLSTLNKAKVHKDDFIREVLRMRSRAAAERQVELQRARQPLREPATRELRALRREVAVMKHRLRRG